MSWFESDRFRLRAAEPADAEALFEYLNHADMYADRQFGEHPPWPVSRDEIHRHLDDMSDSGRTFLIEAGGVVVGHAAIDMWWDALQPWVGVGIDPRYRRHGYGRKAAAMVLEYLFDQTPAHCVVAQAGDWNEAGLRFAEAMGFSRAGRYRSTVKRAGRWRDTITFDLLRREWEAHRVTVD